LQAEMPLLRSGIVLSPGGGDESSSVRAPRPQDRLVTAQEIAGMDLTGVDWAVISACNGGLGVLRPREGLFGLRRAFQIAGARSTILALWSVDDSATRAWMTELYRARVRDRLSTAEAVREASRRVLRIRRSRGLSTHPGFWAPFVATGDWR